jgi:hypothetical protein
MFFNNKFQVGVVALEMQLLLLEHVLVCKFFLFFWGLGM